MNPQDSGFDLPVHITCQQCKHFHKNWEHPLPPAGGRVKCARCRADMFALGRAGTQYTLASVDSIPLSRIGTFANPGSTGYAGVSHSHSGVSTQSPPANDIEQSQLFDERPAIASSQVHATDPTLPEMRSDAPTDSVNVQSPNQHVSSILVRMLQKVPYHEELGTRLAAGLPQNRREYSIFGWRFVIHPPDNRASSHASAATGIVHHSNVEASQGTQDQSPMMTEALDRTVPDAGSIAQGPSNRLIQHRRHKTLVKSALQQIDCRCRGGCRCILRTAEPPTSDTELGDVHSSRPRTPPHPDDIPSNSVLDRLGTQRFLLFSHLGQSTEGSEQSINTSQASTLASSGSVLLRPTRPRLPARTRSMPGL